MTAPQLSDAMSSLQAIVDRVQKELVDEQGVQQRIAAARRIETDMQASNNELAREISAKRSMLADIEAQASTVLQKARTAASAIENDANVKAKAILAEADKVKTKSVDVLTQKEQDELRRLNAEIKKAETKLAERNAMVESAMQTHGRLLKSLENAAALLAREGAKK